MTFVQPLGALVAPPDVDSQTDRAGGAGPLLDGVDEGRANSSAAMAFLDGEELEVEVFLLEGAVNPEERMPGFGSPAQNLPPRTRGAEKRLIRETAARHGAESRSHPNDFAAILGEEHVLEGVVVVGLDEHPGEDVMSAPAEQNAERSLSRLVGVAREQNTILSVGPGRSDGDRTGVHAGFSPPYSGRSAPAMESVYKG